MMPVTHDFKGNDSIFQTILLFRGIGYTSDQYITLHIQPYSIHAYIHILHSPLYIPTYIY